MTDRMRELRNQWSQSDWKRDIARYENARANLRDVRFVGMSNLRNHWKAACNEIADRYPHAKLEKF